MVKKVILFIILLISVNLISAINLEIDAKPISNTVITTIDQPAIFDLTIKNNRETETFEIYSLVGVDITPKTFTIDQGQTKTIQIQLMPQNTFQKGFLTFEYKIKDSEDNIQEERLTINIIELAEAISITAENINLNSETAVITVENKVSQDFDDIQLKIDSTFFTYQETFPLSSEEKKEIKISIEQDKLKTQTAGSYLINSEIQTQEKTVNIESMIKLLKQEGVDSSETKEGIFIKRHEITKTNVGNTRQVVTIDVEKNLISYIFTTFNTAPETQINGFKAQYTWTKELIPNEEFKLIIKTNWLYPILIIIFIIVLFMLIKKSVESDLVLKKQVSFVKTKGGEFALKITLKAKAKSFVERINIIDKLPPLVKLYERFGAIAPDKIDKENKRLEWNVESLNKDEERIFTYIIYSKIGVVGKFELPSARAVYEKEGKVQKTESNRSFFINELKR